MPFDFPTHRIQLIVPTHRMSLPGMGISPGGIGSGTRRRSTRMRTHPPKKKTRLLVPTLLICLAFPSLPRSDSETKQPPVAPGIQHERVNLILIDVIVTDRKGNPVEDLSPEEFRLRVDGKPYPIESVELLRVSTQPAGAASPKEEGETGSEGVGQDFEVRRSRRFVFFFDGLNSERGLGPKAIQAARRFLQKGLPLGDELMVAGQGRELKIYQEFTADREKMLAAIQAVESDPQIRNAGENRVRQNIVKLKEAEDE